MKKSIDSLIKMAMWVAVVAFVLRCAISDKLIQSGISLYSFLGYASEAISIAAVIILLYEKWFWKYIPFSKIPNISGKYNGTIKSDFDNKIRQADIEIKQTRFSIEIIFQTDESKSRTVAGTIENIYGENELVYTFINEPKATHRSHSNIHYGTAILILDSKDKLTGNYFTDRETTGEMEFAKVKI